MTTSEEGWLEALADLEPPPHDLAPPARIVVVAPHPADEVLGIGGLLRHWSRQGTELIVVSITGGECGGPSSNRRRNARARTSGARRTRRLLGVVPEVRRLRLPDGQVGRRAAEVQAAVESVTVGDTWCASTWRGDGEPDHEAAGRATADACASTGASLVEFPVCMWRWARPGDSRVPWEQARAVFLDAPALLAKRAALLDRRTRAPHRQPPLEPFDRPFELVFSPI